MMPGRIIDAAMGAFGMDSRAKPEVTRDASMAHGGWDAFRQYAGTVPSRLAAGLPYALAAGRSGNPGYMIQAGQAAQDRVQTQMMVRELQDIDPTRSPQDMQRAVSIFMRYGRDDLAMKLVRMAQMGEESRFRRAQLEQGQARTDLAERRLEYEQERDVADREFDREKLAMEQSLAASQAAADEGGYKGSRESIFREVLDETGSEKLSRAVADGKATRIEALGGHWGYTPDSVSREKLRGTEGERKGIARLREVREELLRQNPGGFNWAQSKAYEVQLDAGFAIDPLVREYLNTKRAIAESRVRALSGVAARPEEVKRAMQKVPSLNQLDDEQFEAGLSTLWSENEERLQSFTTFGGAQGGGSRPEPENRVRIRVDAQGNRVR